MMPDGRPDRPRALATALQRYAEVLEPWARSIANYMLADINRRNERTWKQAGAEISKGLAREIAYAPTGHVYQMLMNEQVTLIKSLPLAAAERVHDLVTTGMLKSRRAADIAKDIANTGEVTGVRARCIARTEVARASSILTESRARYVGSEGYIWRTAGDSDVRESHAQMEGKYVRWDSVPKLSDGTRTHAGQIYNCRCYAEPVIPND